MRTGQTGHSHTRQTVEQNARLEALKHLQHEIDQLAAEHFRCNSREDSRIILGKIHDKQKALNTIKDAL